MKQRSLLYMYHHLVNLCEWYAFHRPIHISKNMCNISPPTISAVYLSFGIQRWNWIIKEKVSCSLYVPTKRVYRSRRILGLRVVSILFSFLLRWNELLQQRKSACSYKAKSKKGLSSDIMNISISLEKNIGGNNFTFIIMDCRISLNPWIF